MTHDKEYVDVNGRTVEVVNNADDPVSQTICEETELNGQWQDVIVDCPQCKSSDNVYLFCDKKTCYCLECTAEFDLLDALDGLEQEYVFSSEDIQPSVEFSDDLEDRAIQAQLAAELVSDDPDEVNQAIKILELAKPDAKKGLSKYQQGQLASLNQTKNYKQVKEAGFDYRSYGNLCFHRPTHVIAGEGWGIWAGKKDDIRSSLKDFDVVMNLTYTSVKDAHVIPIPQLTKWANTGGDFVEIQMDWPDFGTIDLPIQFWQELVAYIRDNKLKLLIFCQGGHGRTGTAIAALFVVALGYKPIDAIGWVRRNYCQNAIETKGQENYIIDLVPEEKEVIEPESFVKEPYVAPDKQKALLESLRALEKGAN